MRFVCYFRTVSTLQIKDFPEYLEEKLRARAVHQGRSMSAYVVEVLERDLEDGMDLLRQSREERMDRILGVMSERD